MDGQQANLKFVLNDHHELDLTEAYMECKFIYPRREHYNLYGPKKKQRFIIVSS